jgi:hypothetical protein
MREQTPPEHPSKAHERAALAGGAFVTSTATDDLAIKAEDCIPERENSCVQMVRCSSQHMHQPSSLRCGQRRSTRIQRHSQKCKLSNSSLLSHLQSQGRTARKSAYELEKTAQQLRIPNRRTESLSRTPRLLLQLRVLNFGLLQDGNIGVGVFPEVQEVLIGRLGLRGVMLHGISPSQFQACERAER